MKITIKVIGSLDMRDVVESAGSAILDLSRHLHDEGDDECGYVFDRVAVFVEHTHELGYRVTVEENTEGSAGK